MALIQGVEKKVLRNIVTALWYVRNDDIHTTLKMEMVTAEIRRFARKHGERLLHYDNVDPIQMLENSELLRRLKEQNPWSWYLEH
jgi:hypothetical protein